MAVEALRRDQIMKDIAELEPTPSEEAINDSQRLSNQTAATLKSVEIKRD